MCDVRTPTDEPAWAEWPLAPPSSRTVVALVDLALVPPEIDVLDDQERARATRLRTPELRQDFIAAHVAVRRVLGWFLGCAPASLGFDIDAHGKPHLRVHDLRFNLSHSGGHALVALGRAARIGVDLEARHRLPDADRLASRVLAPVESAAYTALPADERVNAFLRVWTRKEAVLKAIGLGLPAGMEHVILGEPPLVVGDFTALPPLAGLMVHDLPVVPGFAAALALDHTAPEPLTLRWRAG